MKKKHEKFLTTQNTTMLNIINNIGRGVQTGFTFFVPINFVAKMICSHGIFLLMFMQFVFSNYYCCLCSLFESQCATEYNTHFVWPNKRQMSGFMYAPMYFHIYSALL